MTAQQLILMSGAYMVVLAGGVYFTREKVRRVMGALVGGAAVGLMALGAIALCKALGWWQVSFASTPYFLPLLFFGFAISCSPLYLITWRVARSVGRRVGKEF